MSNTAAPFDQAAGLRELFASMPQEAATPSFAARPPAVHALICPQRPAMVLPMAQICVQWWREQDVRHMWVDELDLKHRENWPLNSKLRFDLAQGLAQHVPLTHTLHLQASPNAYYASARRLAHYAPSISKPLVAQLEESALVLEHLLIACDPAEWARPWSLYGAPVQALVLCEATQPAVEHVLNWLNAQHANNGLQVAQSSVVFYSADPGSAQSAQAQAYWQASWQALYGHPATWVGHLAVPPGAPLLSHLPSWQALAAQWLPRLTRA